MMDGLSCSISIDIPVINQIKKLDIGVHPGGENRRKTDISEYTLNKERERERDVLVARDFVTLS